MPTCCVQWWPVACPLPFADQVAGNVLGVLLAELVFSKTCGRGLGECHCAAHPLAPPPAPWARGSQHGCVPGFPVRRPISQLYQGDKLNTIFRLQFPENLRMPIREGQSRKSDRRSRFRPQGLLLNVFGSLIGLFFSWALSEIRQVQFLTQIRVLLRKQAGGSIPSISLCGAKTCDAQGCVTLWNDDSI